MSTISSLHEITTELDFFAAADIGPAQRFLAENGFDATRYRQAITLGVRIPPSLLSGVRARKVGEVLAYRYHCQVAGAILDAAASRISRRLDDLGYLALPVPSGQRVRGLDGLASHKVAAHLSGEGVIGLSGLFIHHRFGPAVRLATVFTDAELPVSDPRPGSCQECGQCVSICPAGAISGTGFDPEQGCQIDREACHQYSENTKRDWGVDMTGSICGLCLARCPHARQ